MDNIFTIIGAAIAGLGGSSVIILGLSTWLGKVWANRIFEKEKVKYDKELQDYKSQIDKEMVKLQSLSEKALHISKVQYDKEFEIYQSIWKTQINALLECNSMLGHKGKSKLTLEQGIKYYGKFVDALNIFHEEIQYNAPFYKDSFYKNFHKIWDMLSGIGDKYQGKLQSDELLLYSDCKEILDKMGEVQKELRIEIQNYLSSLRGE